MKLLAVFIAMLVVFTGFDFCKDDECMDSQEKTELSQGAHQQNEASKDACSPYCHCTRCHFSVLVPKKQRCLISYKAVQKLFPLSSTGDPVQISTSIWQPPRLTPVLY